MGSSNASAGTFLKVSLHCIFQDLLYQMKILIYIKLQSISFPNITTNIVCSLVCLCTLVAYRYIANNMNQDHTAPLGQSITMELIKTVKSLVCNVVVCMTGLKDIKQFSCSTQLSMKFQLLIKTKMSKYIDSSCFQLSDVVFIMLINVEMPTTVCIFTFMSMINFMLS